MVCHQKRGIGGRGRERGSAYKTLLHDQSTWLWDLAILGFRQESDEAKCMGIRYLGAFQVVTMAISKDESPWVEMKKTSDSFHTGLVELLLGVRSCQLSSDCGSGAASVYEHVRQSLMWPVVPRGKGMPFLPVSCRASGAIWHLLRVFLSPGLPLYSSSSASSDVRPEAPFSDLYCGFDRENQATQYYRARIKCCVGCISPEKCIPGSAPVN